MLKKHPKDKLSGVFLKSRLKSGLADAVDVTGEVEHLVGEAPLIRDRSALPLIRLTLTPPTITSVSALPFLRFSVFKSKKSISLSQKQRQPSRPLG